MPFCTQCGQQVNVGDVFCASCGQRQGQSSAFTDRPSAEFLGNLSPKTASTLCYIPFVGWIAAILVLASSRFRADRVVRFHAFQGIYLFVIWLLVDWGFPDPGYGPIHVISHLMQMVVLAAWIWMMIKTSQNQLYHLPIIGELADRTVAEQR